MTEIRVIVARCKKDSCGKCDDCVSCTEKLFYIRGLEVNCVIEVTNTAILQIGRVDLRNSILRGGKTKSTPFKFECPIDLLRWTFALVETQCVLEFEYKNDKTKTSNAGKHTINTSSWQKGHEDPDLTFQEILIMQTNDPRILFSREFNSVLEKAIKNYYDTSNNVQAMKTVAVRACLLTDVVHQLQISSVIRKLQALVTITLSKVLYSSDLTTILDEIDSQEYSKIVR